MQPAAGPPIESHSQFGLASSKRSLVFSPGGSTAVLTHGYTFCTRASIAPEDQQQTADGQHIEAPKGSYFEQGGLNPWKLHPPRDTNGDVVASPDESILDVESLWSVPSEARTTDTNMSSEEANSG